MLTFSCCLNLGNKPQQALVVERFSQSLSNTCLASVSVVYTLISLYSFFLFSNQLENISNTYIILYYNQYI